MVSGEAGELDMHATAANTGWPHADNLAIDLDVLAGGGVELGLQQGVLLQWRTAADTAAASRNILDLADVAAVVQYPGLFCGSFLPGIASCSMIIG